MDTDITTTATEETTTTTTTRDFASYYTLGRITEVFYRVPSSIICKTLVDFQVKGRQVTKMGTFKKCHLKKPIITLVCQNTYAFIIEHNGGTLRNLFAKRLCVATENLEATLWRQGLRNAINHLSDTEIILLYDGFTLYDGVGFREETTRQEMIPYIEGEFLLQGANRIVHRLSKTQLRDYCAYFGVIYEAKLKDINANNLIDRIVDLLSEDEDDIPMNF
eukprot:gene17170-20454_t